MNISFKNIIFLLLLLCYCCACSGTKYLKADEQLLKENTIRLKNEEKISNKSNLSYDLGTICRQKPNKTFFLIPRQRFYEKGLDTTRFFSGMYRRLGEAPTIFDSTLMLDSAEKMRYFLQDKGYENAAVEPSYTIAKDSQEVFVNYDVYPNRLYRIDTTIFTSRDVNIQPYLESISEKTLLKTGQPVALETYEAEVIRIEKYLRNNGFTFFRRNYISRLKGDSLNAKVKLRLEIFPPSNGGAHQQYRVGKIFVQPDFNPLDTIVHLKDSIIEGLHFLLNKDIGFIKPEVLLKKITLNPGELYSQVNDQSTYNNLGSLSSVKFISMKQEIDPDKTNTLNYRILLTRNKRYDFRADLEASYAERTIATRANLVGTALNFSLKTRRSPLKGGALLTNSIQGRVEFAVPALREDRRQNTFRGQSTLDIGFQNQINIPRFVDYFGLWRTISRGKKRPDGLYRFLEEQVDTRINLNFKYLELRELYTYRLLNATFGYNIDFFERNRLVINHVGIDYLSPTNDSLFQEILDNNPFLQRSFGQQLFTGVLLRDLNYFYNKKNRSNETYSMRFGLEFSGLEVSLFNSLYNSFALQPTRFKIGDIAFARYTRLDIDARYKKEYTPTRAFAARFNFGIATPYGELEEVPYVKQFYIGGPNSIRAFRARQIGPGSYCSEICVDSDIPPTAFYQTGDLKLEWNLEYRFLMAKIFSNEIEGAFFLDMGNVWTLQNDPERPNSQFRFTSNSKQGVSNAFYNQLAIGTGFGLRFDFSYVLLRVDLGYPIRTPYYVDNPWVDTFSWRTINFNLAIDYPF